MPSRETARSALRTATAPHHDRVDRLFSGEGLDDREGYGRFLRGQARALIPAEAALDRAGAGAILADWPERQRSDALAADLAALGIAMPPPLPAPAFDGTAAILGGVYVLEGSRLGGRMLLRGVPIDFPRAFLGGGDPAAWRRLLGVLEERLVNEDDRTRAIDAAIAVFALFEASAQALG